MKLKIYHIAIYAFIWGLRIHALWNSKSQKSLHGRKQQILLPKPKSFRVWIHCASLGEFEQGRPIIDHLKKEFECEIILTFFSPSGYEVRKHYENADFVFYLPFDTKYNAASFLEKVQPDLCIFVKYEFWWNLLYQIIASEIPLIFISAQFRAGQYLFKNWAKPFANMLKKADRIFVADENSQRLLINQGFKNVSLSGDTRVESILSRKHHNIHLPKLEQFKGEAKLIIMGSTYPKEYTAIQEIITSCTSEIKLAIFPHEIKKNVLIDLLNMAGSRGTLFSTLKVADSSKQILIVDSIGMLADAYRYADIVYVGGGFNKGIHNILEPLVYKIPIIFGPKHQSFSEALQLKKFKGIKTVNNLNEIKVQIFKIMRNNNQKELDMAYQMMFCNNATKIILEYIKQSYLINEKRSD